MIVIVIAEWKTKVSKSLGFFAWAFLQTHICLLLSLWMLFCPGVRGNVDVDICDSQNYLSADSPCSSQSVGLAFPSSDTATLLCLFFLLSLLRSWSAYWRMTHSLQTQAWIYCLLNSSSSFFSFFCSYCLITIWDDKIRCTVCSPSRSFFHTCLFKWITLKQKNLKWK